jgi:hypothetical protein
MAINPNPGFVQVPPNSTGAQIDTNVVTVAGNSVNRQSVCPADPLLGSNVAHVDQTYADQDGPRYGLVTVPAADQFNNAPLAQMERLLGQILLELQAINLSLASMVPSPVLSSELTSSSMPM